MRSVLAGTACTLVFDFIEDGVLAGADINSVVWKLRANDGTVLLTTTVNNGSPIDRLELSIASQYNTNAADFEYRTVTLTYTRNQNPRELKQIYRVTDFLPHVATPAEVRKFIGVDLDELPDADIDLDGAYFQLADQLGALDTTLTSGTQAARKVNLAIVATEVLNLLPSLQLRARQRQTTDTAEAARFSSVNFAAIEMQARDAIGQAAEAIETSTEVAPVLLQLGTPTDVITGS